MFVPNGNCRHGAESSGVIDEKHVAIRNDNIVRELILSDNFGDIMRVNVVFRLCRGPCENLIQARMPVDFLLQQCEVGG